MRARLFLVVFACSTIVAGGAAVAFAADEPPSTSVYSGPAVKTVVAVLLNGEGTEIGNVQVAQDAGGVVQLVVNVSGLAPGKHGIHVHAVGTCEGPAFASASGHFNPGAKKHGLLSMEGHHAGDLRNLVVQADGRGSYTETSKGISLLDAPNSLLDGDGSALVIHAAEDDHLTDPTGNSGGRIACAVLAAPRAASTPQATVSAPLPPNTGAISTSGGDSERMLWLAALLITAAGTIGLVISRSRR